MKARLISCALVAALPAQANVEITFPGPARESFTETAEFDSYKMPIGPAVNGTPETVVAEGPVTRTAWQLTLSGGTTLGIIDNLRQQIEATGFELLYECETQECGGFDFRFNMDVLPEPDMHVDLGDFRYIAAQRLGEAIPEYLSLLVSRSESTAFVQVINVGAPPNQTVAIKSGTEQPAAQPTAPSVAFGSIVEKLERTGSAILEDLQFPSGSSALGEGSFSSLSDLASYLTANPDRKVALVGHTDAEGTLEANIALSRKRARSVADRLVNLGIPSEQVQADGVGFLAPRASNLTEEGRTLNRRVEVVLTSTQ